jgi:phosphoribosyl 1,2-cyclic phosphodiesterase
MRYGGNTTCLYLEDGATRVIIDGGSGIANLGRQLLAEGLPLDLHLFVTHPHWDHVMGLPFFAPLYHGGNKVCVYGAESQSKSLHSILATQHLESTFPVRFQALAAEILARPLCAGQEVDINGMRVLTIQLNHPGMNLGYRFEGSAGGSFVILTDLAPIERNYLGDGMQERAADGALAFEQVYTTGLLNFVRGADLIYFDTNFTDDEIEGKLHWGHSTPTTALQLLSQLDHPPALVLSHHDPNHSDDFMDQLYEHTRRQGKQHGIEVLIGREREGFEL